jgi:hypothetical protein
MIVKAEGPSGPAKISSDDPKHALGLAQYLRTIGYSAKRRPRPAECGPVSMSGGSNSLHV